MNEDFTKVFTEIFKNDDDVHYIVANYLISGVNIVSMVERYYHDYYGQENIQEKIINSIKKDLAQ